jgi:hypothetical protein
MNPIKGKAIRFKTVLIKQNKLMGKKALYRAEVVSPGVKRIKETATDMVAYGCTVEASTIQYVLDFLVNNLPEMIAKDGYRRELGDLVTLFPLIKGSFETRESDCDPAKNPICLGVKGARALRRSLEGAVGVNVTSSKPPKISSVFANGTATPDMVPTFVDEIWPGHSEDITGARLLLDLSQDDEGVWLVPENGGAEVRMNVTGNHTMNITFEPPASFKPAAGQAFTMELRTRAGRGATEALYTVKHRLTVKE